MAGNGGHSSPNILLVRFVFDNHWTVDALEQYVTQYQPEGVLLHTLRQALAYNNVPFPVYAHTLVKLATILVALGHVRSPARVILEFILFRLLTRVTQAEVSASPPPTEARKEKERRRKKGGGVYILFLLLSVSPPANFTIFLRSSHSRVSVCLCWFFSLGP
jgi:hypothetical protein